MCSTETAVAALGSSSYSTTLVIASTRSVSLVKGRRRVGRRPPAFSTLLRPYTSWRRNWEGSLPSWAFLLFHFLGRLSDSFASPKLPVCLTCFPFPNWRSTHTLSLQWTHSLVSLLSGPHDDADASNERKAQSLRSDLFVLLCTVGRSPLMPSHQLQWVHSASFSLGGHTHSMRGKWDDQSGHNEDFFF